MIVHDLTVLTSLYCYLLETGNTRKCFLPHFHYFNLKQIFAVKDSWLFWYTVYQYSYFRITFLAISEITLQSGSF